MKTKSKIIPIAFLSILFGVAACSDFLDNNINPNQTSSNPAKLILPAAEAQLGFNMGSDLFLYSGLWSQQIAAQNGRQTETYDKYILQPTEINNAWRASFYAGHLADIEEILKKPADQVHPHYFGIAKVVKAFSYSILVDFWGDVPFSQALKAGNFQPDIDDDAAIYPQLIALLDEAIVDLKATSGLPTVGAEDYFYGGSGNINRWIKFANTLKLRLYLHMANVPGFDTAVITSFLNATPANELMAANTDDFQMKFDIIAQRQNPTHQFILSRTDDMCTSSTIIGLMNAKSDPRRATYFTPAPFSPTLFTNPPTGTTGFKGLTNGYGNNSVDNSLSRLHTFVRGSVTSTTIPAGPNLTVGALAYNGGASLNILTYAEYNFIRAELTLRYGAPATPKTSAQEWYQEGIRTSILDAGVSTAQATSYLASAVGTLTGTPDQQLQQIIEEKYVANFMVCGESWTDWRRTGYPLLQLLPASLSPGNNGKVPRALLYPQQEVDANPKLASIQRTSLSDRRVFWDTRTTGQE
ncbi:MAG: SusD/RagB family nutrient-binding outer membrane lipoprotein [Cyclobacteriaceae bacterium]